MTPIKRLREFHTKHPRGDFCEVCDTEWPCDTIRVCDRVEELEAAIMEIYAASLPEPSDDRTIARMLGRAGSIALAALQGKGE